MTFRAVIVDPARFLEPPPQGWPDGWSVQFTTEIPSSPGIHAMSVSPDAGRIGAEMLDALPDLRVLGATSVGVDHLDVDAAAARGIAVVNTLDYCTDEVAEHTLAFILMLSRAIPGSDRAVRDGSWELPHRRPRPFSQTTLGLWGFGAIGSAVAKRAQLLGFDVQVCARRCITADTGVRQVDWDQLVGTSDVLSVHVPLTFDTVGAIDGPVLAAMRSGALLVNMSRGGIVDEHAVAAALRSGHLGGAAFDVLAAEPPLPDNPLLSAPNTVITPHAAWYSTRSVERPASQFAEVLSNLSAA
ncbi:2-hydroxyacid dehydrogenase [Gordonia sp. NPDC003424]